MSEPVVPFDFRWPRFRTATRRYIVIPVDVVKTENPRSTHDVWTAVSRRLGHAATGATPNEAVVGLEDWARSKSFDYRKTPHMERENDDAFACGEWCERLHGDD